MEPDMPVHLSSVLRDRLQNRDKQGVIEIYYELLSSGHSVSEILNATNSIRNNVEHDNTNITKYLKLKPESTPIDCAAEVTSTDGAQVNAWRILGLSASCHANNLRTEQPQATGSAPVNGLRSDDRGECRDSLPGSEADIPRPASEQTSASCEAATIPSSDLEWIRSSRSSSFARRIVIGMLCTTAVASTGVIGFSVVHVVHNTQLTIVPMQLGISGGIETVVIPRAAAGREETAGPPKQVVDADVSRAPEPSRPAEPDPEVSGPVQRVAAEIRTTDSPAQPQAEESPASEYNRLDAIQDLIRAAQASDASVLRESSATASTQAAEVAGDAESARTQATGPAAVEASLQLEGDHDEAPAASFAETTRAEQPNATRPLVSGAEPPESRTAEVTPEEPHFKRAEVDTLVSRGDAFFAAGDLASARLFYEYAAVAGNGTAALRLGSTFDSGFLAQARIGRIQGDAAIALYWYRRARDLGNSDALILLKSMENTAR